MSRFLESRASETRKMEQTRYEDAPYRGKLYINPEIIPDNLVLGWFPKSVMNQPDYELIKNKLHPDEGWEIAPPEMFPTLMGPDLSHIFGGQPSRFIEREGNILLMLPKHIWELRQKHHTEESRAVLQQANSASAHLSNDEYTQWSIANNQISYGHPV